jgi:hypothetical protein
MRVVRLGAVLVLVALLGACVDTGGKVVSTATADAAAGGGEALLPRREWVDRPLGASATTPRSSTITVQRVERVGNEHLVAKIKTCVAAKRTPTSFDPSIFLLQVGNRVRQPLAEAQRQPALVSTTVSPGDCVEGWVTYQLALEERPDAVLLLASAYIRWRLPPLE